MTAKYGDIIRHQSVKQHEALGECKDCHVLGGLARLFLEEVRVHIEQYDLEEVVESNEQVSNYQDRYETPGQVLEHVEKTFFTLNFL